jgi:hypothetical protein
MTIEEFWNAAFIAALSRCPVDQAKAEADLALARCIEHWQSQCFTWSSIPTLWQLQKVAHVPKPVR